MLYNNFESICLSYLKDKQSLGIMLSGGLDSAVMLYGLCLIKEKHSLPIEFKVYTVPLHNDSQYYARKVVSWINNRFGIKLEHIICGNPNMRHDDVVKSGMGLAYEQCTYIAIAETTNPPVNLKIGLAPVRTKARVPFQPFIEWTKKETVALSIELTLDELVAQTHSCTEDIVRCNLCWQCAERAWGYAENNYKDPGNF